MIAADMGQWAQLPGQLWHIFYFIVLPMLLLVGVGYLLQRKLGLDLPTLTRLNFYLVMPGIIYYSILTSRLTARQVLEVLAFAVTLFAAMAVASDLLARARKIPADYRSTLMLTTALFNSGNFSLPLQERAFIAQGLSEAAMGIQSLIMVAQNVFTFTAGVLIAAGGRKDRHWKQNLLHVAKLPPLYAVAAALLTAQVRRWIEPASAGLSAAMEPWWQFVLYVKSAFIAVALATLGAQLAAVRPREHRYPVRLSVLLRLLGGPAIALAIIYVYGFGGFAAQVLLIASTAPTAVNCMLLCMEFDNHPGYAAAAVFYSTLLSPLTVTAVIFLARSGLLPGMQF